MLSVAGNVDPVIQVAFGDMTNKYLASFCSKLEYKKYADLSHSSGPQVSSNNDLFPTYNCTVLQI